MWRCCWPSGAERSLLPESSACLALLLHCPVALTWALSLRAHVPPVRWTRTLPPGLVCVCRAPSCGRGHHPQAPRCLPPSGSPFWSVPEEGVRGRGHPLLSDAPEGLTSFRSYWRNTCTNTGGGRPFWKTTHGERIWNSRIHLWLPHRNH